VSEPAAPARLVWHKLDGSVASLQLVEDVMTVGRDETASLRIDEPLVSRLHARIERRGDAYVVLDLGSTNLTRVNGEVVGQQELKDGDELRFARARCVFRAPGSDDRTSPA
jgi:pSer/pThr/pTyr-binding forkhead associated (FHA) protein